MAPKWRELADRIAEKIRNGEYAPGEQLPQIRDPVEAGEGSKSTVHAACKALEPEGLVTSSRGHGTVVRQRAPLKRLGIARYDRAKWRDVDEVAFVHRGPRGIRPLYDAGYEIDHMKEELFARVPTTEEAQLLQLSPGEWAVELHRTTYTADGTVVEFAIGVHAATRLAWAYEFKVPDSANTEDESK